MTDEIKLNKAISDAARAETLMRDELLTECFDALEAGYIKMWHGTATHESSERERLYLAVKVTAAVRKHLTLIAANGRVAQAELNMVMRDQPTELKAV